MKIVLLENLGIPEEILETYKEKIESLGHTFTSYDKSVGDREQLEHIGDADIVMLANTPMSGEVIRQSPNLKYIDIAFTGVDHVDVATAKERGVIVSNAAGYSTEAVAELAIALMIMLLREIPKAQERTRALGTKDGLSARQLNTQTVGIIGLGTIGTRVAELLHAFGSTVLGYRRNPTGKEPEYVEMVDLDTLYKRSDIITLHVPGNSQTAGLIDEAAIAKMKDGAILINTARGPVIDQKAVVKALKDGKLSGAGIDVYNNEPPLKADNAILEAPNTVLTPHIGFYSDEAMLKRAEIVFENLVKYLDGKPQNTV